MQVGDLVRRKNIWATWQGHNPWMQSEEYTEVGIVVKWSGVTEQYVLWATSGLSWEDEDELELVNESR